MNKLIIATLLMFSMTVQAALAKDAITVKEGQVVTKQFDGGTLMDKEMSEKVRDDLIDKDTLSKTNESLNKTIILYKSNEDILTNQKGMLLNQNIELTKTLNETRSLSGWEKVGFFVLGVVVTSAAVYGATKLAK